MNKVMSDKKAIMVFVIPALLLFTGAVLIPMFMSIYYSLLRWDGIREPTFVNIQNYIRLFYNNTDGFPRSMWHATVNALLSLFVQLPLALIFALLLARGIKGEGFFRTVFFIPVTISGAAIAQLWMRIYHPQYGVLNTVLESIGLDFLTRAWLGDVNTVLIAVFVPGVWQFIGYHMLIMYAGAKSIPDEILEAAKIDGATDLKTAFKITIPLMMPAIRVCIILAIIGALRIFDMVFVLTGGGPGGASEVTSTLMFNTIFRRNQYGYGSSMAIVIVIQCLILTLIIRRLLRRVDDISYS